MLSTKAALATEAGKPLTIETVQLGDPAADEVLVEIMASGLCHSDLGFLDGDHAHPFPAIFGHEGAGVAITCGKDVQTVAPGDHVIPFSIPHCGTCRFCTSGRTNFCIETPKALAGKVSRFTFQGEPVATFSGLGTFARQLVVKASQVVRIRSDLPFDQAGLLACCGATGLGAALYTAKVRRGSSVAVFGLGGVGLNVVQGARLAGASMIVGVDLNPAREAIGRKLGLTHFVNSSELEDVAGWIKAETGGGADYCFECVGSLGLLRQAIDSSDKAWGLTVLVGAMPPANLPIKGYELIMGRQLTGSLLGSVIGPLQLPLIADWLAAGDIDIESLITSRVPLDRINEGFQAMREGRGLRTIVEF